MTLLTRWTPFRDLETMQRNLNRFFPEYTRGSEELMTSGAFIPPVDSYEDEHDLVLKMEVPGMDENDIQIHLQNNTLTVEGERKLGKEEKEENFRRIERRYGTFSRSFTLPDTVDTGNVTASYVNGVLNITLPKRAEAKPKQIKISVGKEIRPERAA